MTVPTENLGAALFGATRRKLFALFFGHPGQDYYLREVIARVGSGTSQVQRELAHLADVGLLLRERRGNQVFFRANPDAPIFDELKSIVRKTFGVADVLREALASHQEKIGLAFVYGSVAKGEDTAASDIDLFVVSELAPSDLAEALAEAEESLGRRVSLSLYSPRELKAKAAKGHHFIGQVLIGPKLFVIGDKASLDGFLG